MRYAVPPLDVDLFQHGSSRAELRERSTVHRGQFPSAARTPDVTCISRLICPNPSSRLDVAREVGGTSRFSDLTAWRNRASGLGISKIECADTRIGLKVISRSAENNTSGFH